MATNNEDNRGISLLQEVKLQAAVLVPVLRALREELGRERADRIVTGALREWSRGVYRAVGAQIDGSPREKFEQLTLAGLPRIGGDIDIEWLEQGPDRMDFNVTGCRYADFFRALGEPELGAVLLCESDEHIAELGQGEVQFARSNTIMQGEPHCDFRYRIGSGPKE